MVTASDGFRGLGIQPEASGSVFARDASGPRSCMRSSQTSLSASAVVS